MSWEPGDEDVAAVLQARMLRPAGIGEEELLGRPWLSRVPGMAVRDESRALPGFQALEGSRGERALG